MPMGSSDKQSGSGTFFKVFLGVVLGGVTLMILVCGGLYWFARNAVKTTNNPTEVREIADLIAKIEVPEGYEPTGGMNMNMGAAIKMQMAAFERKGDAGGGTLLLMQMNVPTGANDQQTKQSFEQQMQQSGKKGSITVKKTETREFQIDGQAQKFEFVEGTDPESKTDVHQIVGTFPGRGGLAFLMLREPAAAWDEARVVKMIESISTK
jgi:hypothetical protein